MNDVHLYTFPYLVGRFLLLIADFLVSQLDQTINHAAEFHCHERFRLERLGRSTVLCTRLEDGTVCC